VVALSEPMTALAHFKEGSYRVLKTWL
jgi:hypothetical protein